MGFADALEEREAGVKDGWHFDLNEWVNGVAICLDRNAWQGLSLRHGKSSKRTVSLHPGQSHCYLREAQGLEELHLPPCKGSKRPPECHLPRYSFTHSSVHSAKVTEC